MKNGHFKEREKQNKQNQSKICVIKTNCIKNPVFVLIELKLQLFSSPVSFCHHLASVASRPSV